MSEIKWGRKRSVARGGEVTQWNIGDEVCVDAAAHQMMEESTHVGKILLRVR